MPEFDSGRTLADRFRRHAGTDTHLYGCLMRSMADDFEAGGPVADVCRGYENAPEGSAIQLRVLAGVFRIVLTGRADELRPYYPVLGGTDDPAAAWPVFRRVLAAHAAEVHAALGTAPQTNEVGRSAALFAGLAALPAAALAKPIELIELGASAGLNLLLPHYWLSGDGWTWGDDASPLRLAGAVEGSMEVPQFAIAEAVGCDVAPLDVARAEDRLWLRSFIWPFSIDRHQRFDAAVHVARAFPPRVERFSADDWLPHALSGASAPVVWHSVTSLYWPTDVIERVEDHLATFGATHRLARVSMEYEAGKAFPSLTIDWWPGDGSRETRVLGSVHPHGVPVRLSSLP